MKSIEESYYPNVLKDTQEIVIEPIVKWRKNIDTIQIKDKKGIFENNDRILTRYLTILLIK